MLRRWWSAPSREGQGSQMTQLIYLRKYFNCGTVQYTNKICPCPGGGGARVKECDPRPPSPRALSAVSLLSRTVSLLPPPS